jgi:small neutral amino acid transporter SnatA (MarC family)
MPIAGSFVSIWSTDTAAPRSGPDTTTWPENEPNLAWCGVSLAHPASAAPALIVTAAILRAHAHRRAPATLHDFILLRQFFAYVAAEFKGEGRHAFSEQRGQSSTSSSVTDIVHQVGSL